MTNELVYEGKAKRLFKTEEAGVLRVAYKDDATALNGCERNLLLGRVSLITKLHRLFFLI